MSWKCNRCGACCEVLPVMLLGKVCEHYDKENKLCKIYNERPDVCRVKHSYGEDVTMQCCEFLRSHKNKER